MWKSLRLKIFGSFLLLVLMLALAGGISIYQLKWFSSSVHGLIEDNYKTIKATKSMVEALEREDSGVLIFLLGEPEEGKQILKDADRKFQEAFTVAENNITEKNETEYIEDIRASYLKFKERWQFLDHPNQSKYDMAWYKNTIHSSFKDIKRAVEELMMLNQNSMYEESSALKEKARRAMMPGIVSVIAAIVFSLLLNFYISRNFVRPLAKLTEAVNYTYKEDQHLGSDIKTRGEIKKLEMAINKMIQRFNKQK
jgi:methyl-accepting chemotaxis protein